MSEYIHAVVVVAALVFAPAHLPWILILSTAAYGIAKVRAEAHERANGWRRFVVGR